MRTLLLIGMGLMAGCQSPLATTIQQTAKPSPTPVSITPNLTPQPLPERMVPVSQPVMIQPPMPLEPPPLETPKNYIIHERTTIVMEQMPQQGAAPQAAGLAQGGPSLPVPPLTGPTVQEGMPPGPLPTGSMTPGIPMPVSSQQMIWRQQMETMVLMGPPGSPSR